MARPQPRVTNRNPSPEWRHAWDLIDEVERLLKRLPHSPARTNAAQSVLILREAMVDILREED